MDMTLFWTAVGAIAAAVGVLAALVVGVVGALFAREQLYVSRDQSIVDVVSNLDTLYGNASAPDVVGKINPLLILISQWKSKEWREKNPQAPDIDSFFQMIICYQYCRMNMSLDEVLENQLVGELIDKDPEYGAWARANEKPSEEERKAKVFEIIASYYRAIDIIGNSFESIAVIRDQCSSNTIKKIIDLEYAVVAKQDWDGFLGDFDDSAYRSNGVEPLPILRKMLQGPWKEFKPDTYRDDGEEIAQKVGNTN